MLTFEEGDLKLGAPYLPVLMLYKSFYFWGGVKSCEQRKESVFLFNGNMYFKRLHLTIFFFLSDVPSSTDWQLVDLSRHPISV